MPANLSLSLEGSNYKQLSSSDKSKIAKPELSGDTWTLSTKADQSYSGLSVDNFDSQTVVIKKADFRKLDFRYSADDGGSARVSSTSLVDASFGSGNRSTKETLVFGGGSSVAGTRANLGKGRDYLEFKKDSVSTDGSYNLGKGSDTAVFAPRSSAGTGNSVDLGSDSASDVVNISRARNVKGLEITNFGKEDQLIIGGKSYSYDEVIAQGGVRGIVVKSQDS